MADGKKQELLGAHVPAELADRFKAWARERDGSTAAALRRLMAEAVGDAPATLRGTGAGQQIGVRLKADERAALTAAARERGMTPAAWLRSLALFRLSRRVQWSNADLEELRALFREVRRIGVNVNQVAQRANEAALAGYGAPASAEQAGAAAGEIKAELRKLAALMQGQVDYWVGEESAQEASLAPCKTSARS